MAPAENPVSWESALFEESEPSPGNKVLHLETSVDRATGWSARFLRRMAALQRLGMQQSFRVVAPCLAPQKPYTPPRPTEVSRFAMAYPLYHHIKEQVPG